MNETDKSTTTFGGGASAATAKDTTDTKEVKPAIPYAASGEVMTALINRRLTEQGNVRIPLGTKSALVKRLHPDGRLEVEVPDETGATSVQQFIAFDGPLFDSLLPKLVTI